MNALIRPRTIAVIGASPKRQTLGNVALDNLANYKFAGKVIPVHGEAPEIAGLAAVPADRGAARRRRRGAGLRAGGRRCRRRAPARSPGRADGDRQYRRLLGRAGGGAAAARQQQPHPDARPQLHGPDQSQRRHADLYRRHHLARPQGAGCPDRAVGLRGDLGDQFLYRRLFQGHHHRQRVPRDRRGLSAMVRRRPRHLGDRPGPRIDPGCRPFRRCGRQRPCRRQVDGRPESRPVRHRRAGDPGAHRRPDPQRRRLQGLRRTLWHSCRRRLRGADCDPRGVCREPETADAGPCRPDGHLGRRDRARLRYLRRDRFAAGRLLGGDRRRPAQRAAGRPGPEPARCRPERRPPGGRCAGRHERRHDGGRGRHRRRSSGHAGVAAGQQPAQLFRPPGDARRAQPHGRQADRRDFADRGNHERSAARPSRGHRRAAAARPVAGTCRREEHCGVGRTPARSASPRPSRADARARRPAAGNCRHPWPAAVEDDRPPARELRDSGRQIRRGAFGGGSRRARAAGSATRWW